MSEAIAIRDERGVTDARFYEYLLAAALIRNDEAFQQGLPSPDTLRGRIERALERADPDGSLVANDREVEAWLALQRPPPSEI